MNPLLRNVLAVLAGIVVGWIVNMGLITLSHSIIPLPEGVDPKDFESIKANMHLYSPKHFIMPFLAHALGALAGAYTVARLAASAHKWLAIGIGAFFMIGGIMMVSMLPAPLWFNILDLVVAYIPMGFLGWKLAGSK